MSYKIQAQKRKVDTMPLPSPRSYLQMILARKGKFRLVFFNGETLGIPTTQPGQEPSPGVVGQYTKETLFTTLIGSLNLGEQGLKMK